MKPFQDFAAGDLTSHTLRGRSAPEVMCSFEVYCPLTLTRLLSEVTQVLSRCWVAAAGA